MNVIGTLVSAIADAMTPDGTLTRMRFRTTLDLLITLVVTALAVVLAVGYQVFGRWARRSGRTD